MNEDSEIIGYATTDALIIIPIKWLSPEGLRKVAINDKFKPVIIGEKTGWITKDGVQDIRDED